VTDFHRQQSQGFPPLLAPALFSLGHLKVLASWLLAPRAHFAMMMMQLESTAASKEKEVLV